MLETNWMDFIEKNKLDGNNLSKIDQEGRNN
jgi:hypothetical protein